MNEKSNVGDSEIRYRYTLDGYPHRADGPAIIWQNIGEWAWSLYGYAHRYYGPRNVYGGWFIHGDKIK